MNVSLRRMISEKDGNKRAQLAIVVQSDIINIVREYNALMNRQERIVKALVSAGLTNIIEDEETPLEL